MRFRTELLKEDIRQAPEYEAQRRLLVSAPTRTPIHEKLAKLRADADQLAAAITDQQLASEVKDVLDALDECALSPYAAPALSVQEQRDIVEMLKFDLELLKEDVKQRDVWLTEYKYAALIGHSPVQHVEDGLARLRARVVRWAPAVTDASIAQVLKTEVLDPLELLAKSSFAKR